MAQMGENVGCRMIGEFVDDASQPRREPERRDEGARAAGMAGLVRRVANEMAVPQFHLAEVVGRVLAAVGSGVEEQLEHLCTEELRAAVDGLQVRPSSLVRISLKAFARVLMDGRHQELVQQLLAPHAGGRCVATAHGDLREVERILKQSEEDGDDACLRELEIYAKRIVAESQKECAEGKSPASSHG
jgi:hypothetical protein